MTGFVLSVVFQLAHCVEEAEFPVPRAGTGRIERAWAVHQAETSVDFCRGSRAMTWFVGGLNFQIEHHLFPRICHVHYPAISRLVEETCREFGIRYMVHRSFWAGMRSHFRWLRQMGMPDASAGGETTTAPGARDRSGSPAGVAAGCVEAGGRPMAVDSPGTPGAGTQISRLG